MAENRKTAIVLGGTVPHKALIEKLKERGYYTVLIDYLDNPPAAGTADLHIKESGMDEDVVYRIAQEYKAEIIMCVCIDQLMKTACKVSERLGLPIPFSYETAINTTDKKYMKKIMWEKGIPTSRYYTVSSFEEALSVELNYPLMVKPADANSAAGVKKIETADELEEALKNAIEWSKNGTAIVEEYMEGREVSVYNYVVNGKATVLLTAERLSKITGSECIKCFCSIAPADVSEKAKENMQRISDAIVQAFGLRNTPMFYQAIVNGDDVSVIELAPRLGGGLCFRTIELKTGFDVLDASIDSYLGNEVKIRKEETEYYYLVHQVHGLPCTFDHYEGQDRLLEEGTIDEIYGHRFRGAPVNNARSSNARIAAFISKNTDKHALPEMARKTVNGIDVIDLEGKVMTDRDIYLKEEDL